jgi:hypothetical protein
MSGHGFDRGIWAIWYAVEDRHRSAYERWFHEIHIPEKLSRPGYLWAAHYAIEHDGSCLAFFGGVSAHTFLNPSPGQLASRQSAETRSPDEAQARDPNTWMGSVRPHLVHAPRSPGVGRRIWPRTE